jgi:hypothetical protein
MSPKTAKHPGRSPRIQVKPEHLKRLRDGGSKARRVVRVTDRVCPLPD